MQYIKMFKNKLKSSIYKCIIISISVVLCSGCSVIGEKLQKEDKGMVVENSKEDNSKVAMEESEELEYTSDKIKFTDKINEDLLKRLPALFNYNSENEISDEDKGNYIYNIFKEKNNDGDILNKKVIGGKEYFVLEVSPVEINNEFNDTFNKELGVYTPQINNENPKVYYENGLYYVCTSNEEKKDTFKFVEEVVEKDGIKVVYEKNTLDGIKTVYNVYIKGADNNKGYAIYRVEIK